MTDSSSGKQRILTAAKFLLAKGKTNPSMAEVADASGLSKSALYYFFKNKSDLFSELAHAQSEAFQKGLSPLLHSHITAKEKLEKMILFSLLYIQEESSFSLFVFEQILKKSPQMLERIFEERHKCMLLFQEVIEHGRKEGSFRTDDARKTAELLMGIFDFFALSSFLPSPKKAPCHCLSSHDLCMHFLFLLRI